MIIRNLTRIKFARTELNDRDSPGPEHAQEHAKKLTSSCTEMWLKTECWWIHDDGRARRDDEMMVLMKGWDSEKFDYQLTSFGCDAQVRAQVP